MLFPEKASKFCKSQLKISKIVFCLWQGPAQRHRDEWKWRAQSRKWRGLPLLPSQSYYLCCINVWHAGPHVLFLQRPWWVEYIKNKRTRALRSNSISWFDDMSPFSFLYPTSLLHYCYILSGICLSVVQLSWCSDGKTWLWNNKVWASFLWKHTHVFHQL